MNEDEVKTSGSGSIRRALPELKHDNCKDCVRNCEHAGKDREFVYTREKSCKRTGITKEGLNAIKTFTKKLKKRLCEWAEENEDYDEYGISNIRSSNFYSDVIGVVAEDGTIISAGLIDKEVENNARANNETE